MGGVGLGYSYFFTGFYRSGQFQWRACDSMTFSEQAVCQPLLAILYGVKLLFAVSFMGLQF